MLDSGATVNVIPAAFIKDNKMEYLLKKVKKLDIEEKRFELTAFGIPQGNYWYKRLPMGITPASKSFQAKMIKQFQG